MKHLRNLNMSRDFFNVLKEWKEKNISEEIHTFIHLSSFSHPDTSKQQHQN